MTAPPAGPVRCPSCGHVWGGHDALTAPGNAFAQHRCANRRCPRPWFVVMYHVRVDGLDSIDPQALRVRAEVVLVVPSYGPGVPALLDTLVSIQRTPGVQLSNRDIQLAIACASSLMEGAA
jgi:hypothetical protein